MIPRTALDLEIRSFSFELLCTLEMESYVIQREDRCRDEDNDELGSWFVMDLVSVFRDYAHTTSLQEMVPKVKQCHHPFKYFFASLNLYFWNTPVHT